MHLRHPYDLGGLGFSVSMLWAQVMPFVALQLYEREGDETIIHNVTVFLICSLVFWILTNVALFMTIDLSYLKTFVGTQTAPQYTCELFLTSKEDNMKVSGERAKRSEQAVRTKNRAPRRGQPIVASLLVARRIVLRRSQKKKTERRSLRTPHPVGGTARAVCERSEQYRIDRRSIVASHLVSLTIYQISSSMQSSAIASVTRKKCMQR